MVEVRVYAMIWTLVLGMLCCGCQRQEMVVPGGAKTLLVTNSMFESVAREFVSREEVFIFCLSEPGTCPGHFDILPSQARFIQGCPLTLRFDFQAALDSKIQALQGTVGHRIAEIKVSGGLCEPDSYYEMCEGIGAVFSSEGWVPKETVLARLKMIRSRLDSLEAEVRKSVQTGKLDGVSVLTSPQQKRFCEWLGLKVVGTFSNAENTGELYDSFQQASSNSIAFVIANEPEGRKVADMLGKKINAPVVCFGNFPRLDGEHPFDDLVLKNVKSLL